MVFCIHNVIHFSTPLGSTHGHIIWTGHNTTVKSALPLKAIEIGTEKIMKAGRKLAGRFNVFVIKVTCNL